ncbi:MAG: hypothetical protein Unbinned92contig1002_35 [Prokaryotic dsDNA virus sp.]|nr:MAG: hypothetical protein Unbinned92contig1002_35 [Prokaryotic dsDNA virus sp.]|tara:strand:- start:3831 stop:4109 length:279 start_codon:yes stop_codon:yes gene_type:complete
MNKISEQTEITLDFKTITTIVGFAIALASMYFALKSDIATAMEKPEPVISRQEYDLKDNAIRAEIQTNRELIEKNFEKLETIENRLYEIRKK